VAGLQQDPRAHRSRLWFDGSIGPPAHTPQGVLMSQQQFGSGPYATGHGVGPQGTIHYAAPAHSPRRQTVAAASAPQTLHGPPGRTHGPHPYGTGGAPSGFAPFATAPKSVVTAWLLSSSSAAGGSTDSTWAGRAWASSSSSPAAGSASGRSSTSS